MLVKCLDCEDLVINIPKSYKPRCVICKKRHKKLLRDNKKPIKLTNIKIETYRKEKTLNYCAWQECKKQMRNMPITRKFCTGKCQATNATLNKLYTHYLLVSIYNSK